LYFFGYAKQQQNQPRFLYDFYKEPPAHTVDELKLVIDHLMRYSELRDKPRIVLFLDNLSPKFFKQYEQIHKERENQEDHYSNIPRDVFVCFSSYNNEIAQKIVKELEDDGNTCWISTRNLRPNDTENYWKNIELAIRNTNLFLIISSEDSMRSKDVHQEIELAQKHQSRLIEFKIDEAPHNSLFKHVFDGNKWVKGTNDIYQPYSKLLQRVFEEKHDINSKVIRKKENRINDENLKGLFKKTIKNNPKKNFDFSLIFSRLKFNKFSLISIVTVITLTLVVLSINRGTTDSFITDANNGLVSENNITQNTPVNDDVISDSESFEEEQFIPEETESNLKPINNALSLISNKRIDYFLGQDFNPMEYVRVDYDDAFIFNYNRQELTTPGFKNLEFNISDPNRINFSNTVSIPLNVQRSFKKISTQQLFGRLGVDLKESLLLENGNLISIGDNFFQEGNDVIVSLFDSEKDELLWTKVVNTDKKPSHSRFYSLGRFNNGTFVVTYDNQQTQEFNLLVIDEFGIIINERKYDNKRVSYASFGADIFDVIYDNIIPDLVDSVKIINNSLIISSSTYNGLMVFHLNEDLTTINRELISDDREGFSFIGTKSVIIGNSVHYLTSSYNTDNIRYRDLQYIVYNTETLKIERLAIQGSNVVTNLIGNGLGGFEGTIAEIERVSESPNGIAYAATNYKMTPDSSNLSSSWFENKTAYFGVIENNKLRFEYDLGIEIDEIMKSLGFSKVSVRDVIYDGLANHYLLIIDLFNQVDIFSPREMQIYYFYFSITGELIGYSDADYHNIFNISSYLSTSFNSNGESIMLWNNELAVQIN